MYLDFDLFKTISLMKQNNVELQNIHLFRIIFYPNHKIIFSRISIKKFDVIWQI